MLTVAVLGGTVHLAAVLLFFRSVPNREGVVAVGWLGAALALSRRGRTDLAAHLANGGLLAILTWAVVGRGGLASAGVHAYGVLLVMVAMTAGWRAVRVYGALVIAALVAVALGQAHGILAAREAVSSVRVVSLVVVYGVFSGLLIHYARGMSDALCTAREQDRALRSRHAELQASERRYARMVEQSPDGIVALSDAGIVEAVNPAALEMGMFRADEVVGRHFGELPIFPPGMLEAARRIFAQLNADLEVQPFEFDVIRGDGEPITLEVSARPTLGEAGARGVEATLRDVTSRRKAETDRRNREHAHFRAQRLEALGRIAGGVAHDFNNLLAIIMGNAMLIQREHANALVADSTGQRADGIVAASQRASELTRQLLTFARKGMVAKRPLALNTIIENVRPLLETAVGPRIHLEVDLDPTLPEVLGDVAQLEQVVMNLVVNARDAMPAGGNLRIVTRRGGAASDAGAGSSPTPGHRALLEVIDSGVGMDARTREHAFEPFFTTKEDRGGTGLGLATVHGIVVRSGGTITLESEPGSGTRVRISLPGVEAVPPSSAPRRVEREGATPEMGQGDAEGSAARSDRSDTPSNRVGEVPGARPLAPADGHA